jgi:hypothetical protein
MLMVEGSNLARSLLLSQYFYGISISDAETRVLKKKLFRVYFLVCQRRWGRRVLKIVVLLSTLLPRPLTLFLSLSFTLSL